MREIKWRKRGVQIVVLAIHGFAGMLQASAAPSCQPPPSGLVSWWKGESNANDVAGANNGTFLNGPAFGGGEVNQAFTFYGTNYVSIPASSSLDVGTGSGLTIEAWINPSSLALQEPIVEYGVPGVYAVHFWANSQSPGALYASIIGTDGSENIIQTPSVLNANVFQHVALTYDKTSGIGRIFLNGVIVRELTLGSFTPRTSGSLYIGYRPASTPFGPVGFRGQIDEVAVYNRALSASEVSGIYNASSAGKCTISSNCIPPPAGLVSWWRGQSNATDVISGNNGTLTGGVSFAVGEVGHGFSFNGTGEVIVPSTASLNLQAMTLEVWVNPSGLDANVETILNKENNPVSVPSDAGYELGIRGVADVGNGSIPVGNLAFFIGGISGLPNDYGGWVNGGGAVPTNQWTHCALTFDGTSVRIYINGNLTRTVSGLSGSISATTGPLKIGSRSAGEVAVNPAVRFNGLIDEVSIYNRSLSASEVSGIYNAGTAGKCLPASGCIDPPTGLVSWWKGEANTSDTIGTNNGVISGNTTYRAGRVGQGFAFDGSGDGVIVGNPPSLQLQNFTIETWVRRASASSVSFGAFGSGLIFGYGQNGYGLYLNSDGQPVLTKIDVNNVTSSQSITDTNFHHLAVTKSGSSVVFYIDGVAYPASAYDPGFTFSTTAAIGARGDNLDNSFLGTIDDLAIYNRALSASEVLSIHNSDAAGKCTSTSGCVSPPSGLVSLWKAEGNAADSIGGNNGTITGAITFVPGQVGQSFNFDGVTGAVIVPASSNLTVQDLTIEGWIMPTTVNAERPVVEFSAFSGQLSRLHLWYSVGNAGTLYGLIRDPGGASLQVISPGGLVRSNQWNHVAMTFDRAGRKALLYLNGVNVASNSSPVPIQPQLNVPVNLGLRPEGSADIPQGRRHIGRMDEMSIYNRVLTGAELEGIFNAGSAGKCTPVLPPTITSQPGNQTKFVGDTATFSIGVTGSFPLSYQWRFNGTNITGATAASLTLNNIQMANAGNYSVLVTNQAGMILSSNAALIVNAAPPCLNPPTGLVGWWKGDGTPLDQTGANNGTLAGNTTYGQGRVGQGFTFDGNGDGVLIGNPAALRLQNFTIETWIRRSSTSTVSFGTAGIGVIVGYGLSGYALALFPNGQPFITQVGAGNSGPSITITDTNLHHLAVTKSGGTITFYVDGVSYSAPNYDPSFVFSTPLAIGAKGDGFDNSFMGTVDEASIYNRALSGSELVAIYNANSSGKCATPNTTNCAPPGIISWWPGEGNPSDVIDGNSGTMYGVTFTNGVVGQTFKLNGSTGHIRIADRPNLRFTNGLTVEAWINPTLGIGRHQAVFGKWDNFLGPGNQKTFSFSLNTEGQLYLHVSATGSDSVTGTAISSTTLVPGQWSHVAGTYDGSSVRVYVNGVLRGQGAFNQGIFPGTNDMAIGGVVGGSSPGDVTTPFVGPIDEPAIYSRGLSAAEILGIYNAGSAGKCSPQATPPSIVAQPQSLVLNPGATANFTVTAGGTPPLLYQWTFNGTNLPSATTSSLSISNVQSSQAGNYAVKVTNAFGAIVSSNALLTINTQPPCNASPPGLVGWWRAEGNGANQAGTNNGTLVGNTTFGTGRVGQAFVFDGSGDGVDVGNPSNLQLQTFTIEAWVKRSSSSVASLTPWQSGAIFVYAWGGYGFGLWDDGRPFLTKVGYDNISPTFAITDTNSFHHVAVTKSGSTVMFYLDGVGQAVGPYTSTFEFGGPAAIGARGGDYDSSLLGSVDEVSVYNRPLSAGEIQGIYAAGSSGKCVLPPPTNCAPSGIISWWPGEGNGNDVVDANSGIFYGGVSFTNGVVGQAFKLDGTSGHIRIADRPNLRFINGLTVEAWVNPVLGVGRHQAIIGKWDNVFGPGTQKTFSFSIETGGRLYLNVSGNGLDSITGFAISTNSLVAGQWSHVAATYDGSSVRVYVNGVLQGHAPYNQGIFPGTNDMAIGGVVGGSPPGQATTPFVGSIDEPAIYNRGLSAGEILAIYNAGSAGKCSSSGTPPCANPAEGLVGWWKGEGTTLDQAGTNNGTLSGNPSYAAGRVGQGFVFDGSGDAVALNNHSNLQIQNFTIEAWIQRSSTNRVSFDFNGGEIFSYGFGGYVFGLKDDGHPFLSKVGISEVVSGQSINDLSFHHVAVTKNGSNVVFYVDGVNYVASPFTDTFTFATAPAIGARGDTLRNSFLGIIDEVSIYNRGLSAAEILSIYGAGGAGKCTTNGGCIPAPPNAISWWKAEGNGADSVDGNNATLLNGAGFTNGHVGLAFNLDGVDDLILVSNSPSLNFGPGQDFTIEAWIRPLLATTAFDNMDIVDKRMLNEGATRGYEFVLHEGRVACRLSDSTTDNGHDFRSNGPDMRDGKYHHVALTVSRNSTTGGRMYQDGQLVLTFDPTADAGDLSNEQPLRIGRNAEGVASSFKGQIDELTLYRRSLNGGEIQAIFNAGTAGKCGGGVTPTAPFIVTQPVNQSVTAGANVTFTVSAGGTQPLYYQWRFNGTNLPGATASSLLLSNVQAGNAGLYSVLVSNMVNSILSSNALLTVNPGPSRLRIGEVAAASGASVTVPVSLTANGLENALQFSLNFNPSRLVYQGTLLAASGGAILLLNESGISTGRVGVVIALPAGETFSPGTQQLVEVTFTTAIVTSSTTTPISFTNSPLTRQVSDAAGNGLDAIYTSGAVSIAPVAYEADVSPRPGGDRNVTVTDSSLIGLFAARLRSPTNASEFQRADCAPRVTLGNGVITVTDWVQALRYVALLDPLTPVGGPTGPGGSGGGAPITTGTKPLNTRQLRALDSTLNQGQTGTVSVSLQAEGNENALGFSLTFDPASLSYAGVTLGSAAAGAFLNVNTNYLTSGQLGFALVLPTGSHFASGLGEVLQVTFQALVSESRSVSVGFSDAPVDREISDPTANALPSDYLAGTVTINPLPVLKIVRTGPEVFLSWPGWATNFILQESSNPATSESWQNVSATTTTTNNQTGVFLPVSGSTKFYRLLKQ
jgi:hypothetical protein